ncbi:alpha-glucosidase/alpha-galactosidase [Candidatus Haliotispira prima]|uniref:Alpha-glucosidase/alpha-galactosidase n=1 Tax=Candidatus Haliotispira prima TaxID=3034016 RepID=A0ABY8MJ39_9SPIO|nr:alpha-glucosidase/alpha-galactosidase [Candidatus Haliotispira prima]
MPKITIIGAGSTVFARNIIGDILFLPAFREAEFALYDVDEKRLDDSMMVCGKMNAKIGAKAKFEKFCGPTKRRESLKDSDFVISMFQVGGYEPATVIDFEVSKKHGLRHTIADTLGAAGIMRGLRSVPVFLDICDEILEVCPEAWLLNYVNPMAMISWAVTALRPQVKYVGLCHSVQGTAHELARDLEIPDGSLSYLAAGINHMAFYLHFEQVLADGSHKNLYPEMLEGYKAGRIPKENTDLPRCPNLVRYEMFKYLGYFVTESSEHFAEYTPYFIKAGKPELIEQFRIPLDEYPQRCIEQVAGWKKGLAEITAGLDKEIEPSKEYASKIVNAIWTGKPEVINGNVANCGLIDNVLQEAAVEVPCFIDSQGIHPVKVGKLPPHLAALIATNVNVQSLFVEAFVQEDVQWLYHAAMMDPHTAAELSMAEIYALMDELLTEHKKQSALYRLPGWV